MSQNVSAPAYSLDHTIALLERTPATLDALLRTLPEDLARATEGPGTWSAYEILGHLIDGERVNWLPRARMILEQGEHHTFPPFDRGGHIRETAGRTLPQLLDEFARVRTENLRELRSWDLTHPHFASDQLALRGNHPAFGPLTLGQLLATWGTHDLTHLHQLTRILAHQHREAVGPWTQYLGVLQCQGHSS